MDFILQQSTVTGGRDQPAEAEEEEFNFDTYVTEEGDVLLVQKAPLGKEVPAIRIRKKERS